MTIIFNGRVFARQKEKDLRFKILDLRRKGVKPKLVSILVGENPASILYVNLKKKAAERIEAEVDVRNMVSRPKDDQPLAEDIGKKEISDLIESVNQDKNVHGIMVQLPLPENFSLKDRNEILNAIAKEKDVDGLREDSPFLTPTVKATLEVIKEATQYVTLKAWPLKLVVVGAGGFEGRKIYKVLKEMGYEVEGLDRKSENFKQVIVTADILISVTGSPGIIGSGEIKEGAVVIDVGSPKGDVVTREVLGKASFISPVPGGVGPVTISCLLENLVD